MVLASLLFLAAVQGASPDSFDRAAAVARIEARLSEYRAWSARRDPLYAREKAGEDVAALLEALNASKPDFGDLVEDAERIVQADPTDEAAFEAIAVASRGNRMEGRARWKGSVNEARQARMERALLAHHVRRADLLSAIYFSFPDPQTAIDFWKQVLERSPHTGVRASAARSVMKSYAEWADETGVDAERRESLRAQVRHHANLIKTEYAGESTAVDAANGYLAALDYSAGKVMPDVAVARIAGGSDSLRNYRGKVVLIDFWTTWCGPCRRDHPKLAALKQQLRDAPFEIISVSADAKPELVTDYLTKERNLPWPQWFVGPKGALLREWGVQGYPTYLLVDGQGRLQARGGSLQLDAIMKQARSLLGIPQD